MKPCGTSVLARHRTQTGKFRKPLSRRAEPAVNPYIGEKRGLIILVSFPDMPFIDEDPLATWTAIANEEGYDGHNAMGSASDYFRDQSYGQFRLSFDVVGPIEAKHDYAYYGQNINWGPPTGWFDQHVDELVEEACRGAGETVTFSDYDWNGDGEVEQVFLLYAGHGENDYWYRDSTVIWPHMATLSIDWVENYKDGLTLQGVLIDTYACSNEINRSGKLAGMGTFCHEFSHCLGLPDLYDTEKGNSVLGSYDLMDMGSYNGNGWCPVGYSSYERLACGWLTPSETDSPPTASLVLDSDDPLEFYLRPLHQYPDAMIYRVTPDANDYYLIENRQKKSWDTYIPNAGLLAWHIDYDEEAWATNTVNNDPDHPRVMHMEVSDIPRPPIKGDVNGDGVVNAADIVEVVNIIMGHIAPVR